MAEESTKVELGDRVTGKVERTPIDITPFIGTKAKIEVVEEHEGKFGFFLLIQTEVVKTIGEGEKAIRLRGSRSFGLIEDEKGNIGWEFTDGKLSELGQFLKKMGVSHYRDLVGKEVILQSVTKNGTDYLNFN